MSARGQSPRRRVQRSVRLSVASGLLAAATLIVVLAIVFDTAPGVAAVLSLVAGVLACRIVYTEVVQTRALAARDRAEQARGFEAAISRNLAEHADFTALVTRRIEDRDQTITELYGTIRLAERRADDAELRVLRESRRANDAQRRLSVLLDEVAAHQAALEAEAAATEQLSDLPTIVDLLAWEEKVTAVAAQPPELRQDA